MGHNDWYSNKDLFEQINALRSEMQETRTLIKQYNGLREKMEDVEIKQKEEIEELKKKINEMEYVSKGGKMVGDNINRWVLFAFACITIVLTLINFFK